MPRIDDKNLRDVVPQPTTKIAPTYHVTKTSRFDGRNSRKFIQIPWVVSIIQTGMIPPSALSSSKIPEKM